jgi:hypothetical protein
VYTVAIGDFYQRILKLTYPSIKKYADKIGADLIIQDKPDKNLITQKWQKFHIYNLLNRYDRVLYLDVDILVRDDCPDLFGIVPSDKLGMFNEGKYAPRLEYIQDASKAYGIDLYKWDKRFFNSGIMVISRIHKQLFKMPPHTDTIETDQPYINLKIAVDKIEMFELSYNFNRMDILDKEIGISRYNSYIIHYAGAPQDQIFPIILKDIQILQEASPNYDQFKRQQIVISISAGMGDQLCAEPVVRYIRNNYFPTQDLTVVTHHPRLFEHIKGIQLLDYKQYQGKADATLVLYTTPEDEGNFHSMSHVMFHPTDFAAMSTIRKTIPNSDKPIKLKVYQEDINELFDILDDDKINLKDLIVVHPGRWWDSKTFPVEWWQEVIDGLAKSGHKLVIIGKQLSNETGKEQGYQNVVCPEGSYDFRDLTSLGGMIALISQAKCTLTNDSSPVHIAGAFDNWLIVIPTAKHPDHIMPFRKDENGNVHQYHKAKTLYKKLTLDALDTCWLSENPHTIDKVIGDILDYIPEPQTVIDEINKIFPKDKVEI